MHAPGREPLYAVMERWVNDCLRNDGSLLAPGSQLWSEANLTDMKSWFVDQPDGGDRSFDEKLADQVAGVPAEGRLLAVEIHMIQMLPMGDRTGDSKRADVQKLLRAVDLDIDVPPDVIAACDHVFAKYGQAMQHKYWHVRLIHDRALAFKRLDPDGRDLIIDDPVRLKEHVTGSGIKRVGTMENMLLHAIRPDRFEPIASSTHKRKIVAAFPELTKGEKDVDLALHEIHTALNAERGDYVSFYDDATRSVWDPDGVPSKEMDPLDHPMEIEWRQRWAAFAVDQFRMSGGRPSLPDDPSRRGEVERLLDELAASGDVAGFLDGASDIEDLRRYWSGPHTLSLREWIEAAPASEQAARRLAAALRAPTSESDAADKLAELDELRRHAGRGVAPNVLAAMVWHWQDDGISPWTMAEGEALTARGIKIGNGASDSIGGHLAHQESVEALDQPIPWLFAALDALNRGEEGLRTLPPVDIERCDAVARGEDAHLVPVLADLETVLGNLRGTLGLPQDASIARSIAEGPDVWAELRSDDRTHLRLWAHPDGIAVACRAEDGPAGLALLHRTEGGVLQASSDEPAEWRGVLLTPDEAANTDQLLQACNTVAVRTTAPTMTAERRPLARSEQSGEDRLAGVADRCFVPRDWVDEVIELLEDRKQLIFYGPPGTGKTFIARELARALTDTERARLIQFHPAYSYEDFFEGLRPTTDAAGQLTYELQPGPLRTIAARAHVDRDATYVLIIDEINRANLPKVFGELLFLLEYRDDEVQTMYGGEPFSLPPNLLIIATMNTADRSIALVDAALRRRFHFVPLFPDREPLTTTLHDWLLQHGEDTRIAELLDRTNAELRERLGDDQLQIGPSHFMKRGITNDIGRVWRYSIEPLLEEQLYGQTGAIDALRWTTIKRGLVTISSDGTPHGLAADETGTYDHGPADSVDGAP